MFAIIIRLVIVNFEPLTFVLALVLQSAVEIATRLTLLKRDDLFSRLQKWLWRKVRPLLPRCCRPREPVSPVYRVRSMRSAGDPQTIEVLDEQAPVERLRKKRAYGLLIVSECVAEHVAIFQVCGRGAGVGLH